jgi:hypothetical protein
MEFVREYFIHEVTYKYVNEGEKEFHENHMVSAGFTVVRNVPKFMQNSLMVTYQKRQLNDGRPRL